MKKGLMALLAAAVLLTLTGCGIASSNQELYERAQLYLGGNDYQAASALFTQLGEYQDSADYALYAKSLLAWQDGDLTLARHGLEALHPFKSTGRYLAYLDALDAEKAGNTADALARFEDLGTFGDSPTRAQILRERLKEEQREAEEKMEAEKAPEDAQPLDTEDTPDAGETPVTEATEPPAEASLSLAPLLRNHELRAQLSLLAKKELVRRHAETASPTPAPTEQALHEAEDSQESPRP